MSTQLTCFGIPEWLQKVIGEDADLCQEVTVTFKCDFYPVMTINKVVTNDAELKKQLEGKQWVVLDPDPKGEANDP